MPRWQPLQLLELSVAKSDESIKPGQLPTARLFPVVGLARRSLGQPLYDFHLSLNIGFNRVIWCNAQYDIGAMQKNGQKGHPQFKRDQY
jgi:hypothetical protein